MPLDRAHVTAASRIMLPTYVLFFVGIGTGYISGFRVGAAPMLRYANDIMPLEVWGATFIACGLVMATAMLIHQRLLYRYALLLCGVSMAVWTIVAVAGIWFGEVSATAWLYPFIIMQACRATDRSLARGERD